MSQRYQREIEEILRQAGESTSSKGPGRTRGHPFLARLSRLGRAIGGRIYLNPGRLLFTGVALLLSAVLVSALIPGMAGPVVWAGLILFILAYALFFAQSNPRVEKRWRGRVIDSRPPTRRGDGWQGRFQRWLRR
ncbi:MAG: hypothetical protein HW388_1465 [Dehalococcoidia bacterium]|nr:hypothetical protein [Dehalococcoidia bacterium]